MSDDKSKVGSPDRDRINTHEDYEVRHWSKKFGVSADEIEGGRGQGRTDSTNYLLVRHLTYGRNGNL